MKQKVLIKVSMTGHKCQRKAMKIAVGISGVDSASLKGEDKCQIEVVGDGIDVIELTTSLRKNVGYAELVSVGPVDAAKKEDEKKKDEATVMPMVWSYGPPHYHQVYDVSGVQYNNDPSSNCSIM